MGYDQFFFPLDEVKGGKKTECLMCRIERPLFLQLKQKANEQGITFSDIIRQGCQAILK